MNRLEIPRPEIPGFIKHDIILINELKYQKDTLIPFGNWDGVFISNVITFPRRKNLYGGYGAAIVAVINEPTFAKDIFIPNINSFRFSGRFPVEEAEAVLREWIYIWLRERMKKEIRCASTTGIDRALSGVKVHEFNQINNDPQLTTQDKRRIEEATLRMTMEEVMRFY